MWLVVGLGNPGRRYAATRHNVGFSVIETLAKRWSIPAEGKQLGSLVGTGRLGDCKALLARPQSFMNRSGHPVQSLLGYFKLGTERLVVAHDDLDLPFGRIQVKRGGGHGGHNGLRDINKHSGSGYIRVRVGIGRPPEGWDVADYVLGKWTPAETTEIPSVVDRASDAIETVLRDGLEGAMNQFNVRPKANSPIG
ncbi:MAG: aminoacyl-tRNA hydrolase [Myxococcota bacterium]|jgi:PTH1 family peptidyl-tRNA hydrolase|nr:aminoacyl-tRNA hydrolase [Myxococcota bacterium]MEC9389720.1 aminoacyl-tRNA hydrolase [Myxococcota bacterium]